MQCVAFRNNAEFAEKYLRQGTKIAITGRIQTGSYNDREGRKGIHYRGCC
ncbi:MAG: single-stranded DNA-binding protein [Alistipes putredinis]